MLVLGLAQTRRLMRKQREKRDETAPRKGEFFKWRKVMAWTAPVIVEVCVGMEITSYESAEI
jgi:coenzyme PQQ precursor peptide PqqA